MRNFLKKFRVSLAVCLLAFTSLAATIVWYSDLPLTSGLSATDIIVVETSGPQGYKSANLAQVASYMISHGIWTTDGNTIFPVTNHPVGIFYDISTNSGTSLPISSSLFNSSDANISAVASINPVKSGGVLGPTYTGNLSLSSQNGANAATINAQASSMTNRSRASILATTNGVDVWELTYNGVFAGNGLVDRSMISAEAISTDANGRLIPTNSPTYTTINSTTINVSGKATLSIVNTLSTAATNGFFVFTNTWANYPTGTVDMSIQDQAFRTYTPMSITGLINRSNIVEETVIMSVTNAADTNCLLTLAAGISLPQRTNQVAVSNASRATLTLRYHPAFGTNAVFVQF
jgi:hypothetical protein